MVYITTYTIKLFKQKTTRLKILLLSGWLLGFLLGFFSAFILPDFVFSMVRSLIYQRMSIVWSILSLAFPLVITAFLHLFYKPQLLSVFSFAEAYSFGFVSCCIYIAFGSAGWLIWWLVCFTGIFSNICLLNLWLSLVGGDRKFSCCFVNTVLIMAVIVIIDFSVVSPFLVRLLDY